MTSNELPADVLRRLEEVASREYPFQVPEREKIDGPRINLMCFRTLRPVLISGIWLLVAIARPALLVLCLIAVYCRVQVMIFAFLASCFAVGMVRDKFSMHWLTDGRVGLGGAGAEAGIICKDTVRNQRIVRRLSRFVDYKPSPLLWSGDLITLWPYLAFKGSIGGRVNYQRWWVKVCSAAAPDGPDGPKRRPTGSDEDEAIALDFAMPAIGYNENKPIYLILHGLNGGSTEPYVLDMVRKVTKEGCIAAVMIARGMMKTHVRGPNAFTGARTSDVGATVDAILHAFGAETRSSRQQLKTRIVLVGFSMGGIIAANYTAKAREESGLVGAVSFSGTLSSEEMLKSTAQHSINLWQPVLAWGLKYTILRPQQAQLAKRGFTAKFMEGLETVTDIDRHIVCAYHGYKDVHEYYEDMSAGGKGDDAGVVKLGAARVPLLAVHAIDDPIAVFECSLASKVSATENAILLATKHGGHIGWPYGWRPSANRWNFMVDVAVEFAAALQDD